MSPGPARAGDLVAEGLRQQSPEVRGLFLRDVLAHAVAGLTVLEGASAAGEAVYRLADAVATRGRP